jgi:hypothetical protein
LSLSSSHLWDKPCPIPAATIIAQPFAAERRCIMSKAA